MTPLESAFFIREIPLDRGRMLTMDFYFESAGTVKAYPGGDIDRDAGLRGQPHDWDRGQGEPSCPVRVRSFERGERKVLWQQDG